MNIIDCVKKRKSIRGYKKEKVPRRVIEEILEISIRAPSGLNTQPWEFLIVEGEVLDSIRKGNVEHYSSGQAPHSMFLHKHQGVYRQRQIELAQQLFSLMDIKREDHAKREEWMKKGLRFFDAPAAIILLIDESMSGKEYALFDLGLISQTICLTALSYGLGTCIELQGALYPEVIRKHTGLPDSKKIIVGIAVGYPDPEFPANRIETEREPLQNIATWQGFDD